MSCRLPITEGDLVKEAANNTGLLSAPEAASVSDSLGVAASLRLHRPAKWGLCAGTLFDYGLTLGYLTRRCSSGRSICYLSSDGTIYPCTSCAGEKILSPGNIKCKNFADFWRSDWEIRHYSWDKFRSTCEGCVINHPEYHCSSRCPAMSYARHRQYFKCGASDFEILSTIVRTAMLKQSHLAAYEHYIERDQVASASEEQIQEKL
jgi:radical SAM protein with 4Fe4S-binding SPASM domain